MRRIRIGGILAGAAVAAAAGAAWLYAHAKAVTRVEHEVLQSEGAFEVRRYPALLVAETVQVGSRENALSNGFGLLADYIFAETRGGEEIEMIAPLLAERTVDGAWRVRLAMPLIWTRETLPTPGEGVAIGAIAARRVAALRFSGRPGEELLARKEAELRAWMEERGLEAQKGVEHAFYTSSFIPGPFRHNEVLIELV